MICGTRHQSWAGNWRRLSWPIRYIKKNVSFWSMHWRSDDITCMEKTFEVFIDQTWLKWLLSLHEPCERLWRSLLDIQDFDFAIAHAKVPTMVLPDALTRDAVPKPLYQRCYNLLTDGEQSVGDVENFNAVMEAAILESGPTTEKMLNKQKKSSLETWTHTRLKEKM